MPEILNCVFIHCENKEEATKILLEVYNQKSNPIDKEVLLEWLEVQEIPVTEIAIETINMIEVAEEDEESESSGQESSPVIKLQYSPDEHEMVLEGLSRIAQTPEAAVWELLGLDENS